MESTDPTNELTPRREDSDRAGAMQDYVAPQFCDYCGAKLNPLFYFCLGCATPFKAIGEVIPPHRPRKLTGEELVNLKASHVAPLMWAYAAVIIGSSLLVYAIFTDDRPDLQLYVQDTIFFVMTSIVAAIYWRTLMVQFKRFGFLQWEALAGLAILIPMLGLNWAYHGAIMWLFEQSGFEIEDDYITMLRDAGVTEGMLVFAFCVLPGVTEEIGFRGLIQHWLHVAIKPMWAILFASALFAAVHFSIISFPYLLLVGVLLGWVKYRTGSLYPSMLIHFLHNLVVIQLLS